MYTQGLALNLALSRVSITCINYYNIRLMARRLCI